MSRPQPAAPRLLPGCLVTLAVLLGHQMAAAAPRVWVHPWPQAQQQAAISLTFDDGLATQLDVALPLLEARGFPATFYVIVDRLRLDGKYRRAVSIPIHRWQELVARGHEIGSHTVSHEPLDQLDSLAFDRELYVSQFVLETLFPGRPVISLSYPNSAVNPAVTRAARQCYNSARAGSPTVTGTAYNELSRLDLFRLKSLFLCNDQSPRLWNNAVTAAMAGGGWLIETMHPVSGPGYCRITEADLSTHLTFLYLRRTELWIATVGDVAARLTAWRRTMAYSRALGADSVEVRLDASGDPTGWQVMAEITDPAEWALLDPDGGEHPAAVERGYLCFAWPAWAGPTVMLRRVPRPGDEP